jgi:predicted HicB family RNase H-like nuclease
MRILKPTPGARPIKEQTAIHVIFPTPQLYKQVKQAAKAANLSMNRFVIESLLSTLALTTPPPKIER